MGKPEKFTTPLEGLGRGECPTNADLIDYKMTPDMRTLTKSVRKAIGRHIPTCLDCTVTSLTIDGWTPEQERKTIKRAKETPFEDLLTLVQKAISVGDMTTVKTATERCRDFLKTPRDSKHAADPKHAVERKCATEILKFIIENTFQGKSKR
ncbi:hypothetical protein HZC21_04690 [Candidatus Peregrinibacteria bacterium]|nr:hypothetical protein [Candidatus Peregrinibacteria bacterium]